MKRELKNPAQERLYGDKDFGLGGTSVLTDRESAIVFKKEFQTNKVYFEEKKKKFEVISNNGNIEVIEVKKFDFTNPVDKLIYGKDYKKDK